METEQEIVKNFRGDGTFPMVYKPTNYSQYNLPIVISVLRGRNYILQHEYEELSKELKKCFILLCGSDLIVRKKID